MESTASVGTRRRSVPVSLSARASESSLLPPAVGPQTTSAVFLRFCNSRDSSDPSVRLARVQYVGPCGLYFGLYVVPRRDVGTDVNGVTTPRLPDSLAILRAAVTDVDLLYASDLELVPREGVPFDLPQHLEEAPLDDGVGHGPCHPRCLGATSRGELEDVGRVESAVLDEPERLFVVLLSLAGMAHDNVRAERAVRHGFPEDLDLAPVPLRFVPAVHDLQHPVRSGLHGQMEPLHDGIPHPDGPERAVLHVGRVARRKPHARRALRDGLQEVAEPLALVPPRIHRLAQQRHVAGPGGDEVLYLPDYAFHRATCHTPPHGRDYAVTALVVAPGHYRDEGVVLARRARQFRGVRL